MALLEKDLKVTIDGASLGNPGSAGIGIVIADCDNNVIKEISEAIGNTTNNVAEYTALIRALEEAAKISNPQNSILTIFTDSELIQRQFCGKYKVKSPHLLPLFKQVCNLSRDFQDVKIVHVPREQNKHADELASLAAKNQDIANKNG